MADDAPSPAKVDRRFGPKPPGTVVGRPFAKGNRANPGGIPRPKPLPKRKAAREKVLIEAIAEVGEVELEQALVAAGPSALRFMVALVNDEDAKNHDRAYAARTILDKLKANAAARTGTEEDAAKKKQALEQFVEVMQARPPGGGDAPS